MEFDEFKSLCIENKLDARDKGNGHWQVVGGKCLVNFYPGKGTVYVNGAVSGVKNRTPKQAVLTALGEMSRMSDEKAKRKQKRALKKMMLQKFPFCLYCNVHLDNSTATIDHRIPLSRGGSNRPDNLVLSCQPCNQKKGSKL